MTAEDSAVTVHVAEAPHNIQDHASNNAGLCGEMMLVLGPEHARILAKDGMSKNDVREELHRRLRLQFSRVGKGLREWYRGRWPAFNAGPEVTEISYGNTEQVPKMENGYAVFPLKWGIYKGA